MVGDLAGEEARTRPTSSDVTGETISSTEPRWEGNDKSLGTDTDNAHNVSLTESRSLTISCNPCFKRRYHYRIVTFNVFVSSCQKAAHRVGHHSSAQNYICAHQ